MFLCCFGEKVGCFGKKLLRVVKDVLAEENTGIGHPRLYVDNAIELLEMLKF